MVSAGAPSRVPHMQSGGYQAAGCADIAPNAVYLGGMQGSYRGSVFTRPWSRSCIADAQVFSFVASCPIYVSMFVHSVQYHDDGQEQRHAQIVSSFCLKTRRLTASDRTPVPVRASRSADTRAKTCTAVSPKGCTIVFLIWYSRRRCTHRHQISHHPQKCRLN